MIHIRTSSVNELNINSLATCSTLEIGDSRYIQGLTRAVALQREQQLFYSNEIDFSKYDIFQDPIPFEPFAEQLNYERIALQPIIKVNRIKITGASTSSVVQIGNCQNIYLESRIKHIRQLNHRNSST